MKNSTIRNNFLAVIKFLAIAAVFSLTYTQEPIYNSPEDADGNQNTKYLLGLAKGGYGFLNEDWLANTVDPLPAFSFLVEFTYKYIDHEYAFYIYYGLLMGVYVYSLLGIVNSVYNIKESRTKYLLYLALFIGVHTVNLEIGSFDTAWHLHSGVAQQYILGSVFQPSSFGVFILLSIWLFLYEQAFWAVVALVIAATFHPAYIFSVAVLTLSYIFSLIRKNAYKSLLVGGVSFLLILPVLSYTYFTFQATTPELKAQATDIIVNFRIPYHSIPDVWLTRGRAQIQALVVIVALYLIKQTKLAKVLLIPFLTAFYLTVFHSIIDNNTLAFIAPWRLSVFLVPISTSIIIASLTTSILALCKHRLINQLLTGVSLAILCTLFIWGIDQQIALFQYRGESTPVLNFVKQNKQSGETYLVPPNSQELQKFRLYTGVPIYTNKKSHPYKDTEVIEWYNRLTLSTQIYEQKNSCQLLQKLATKDNITHVVVETDKDFQCEFLGERYKDNKYIVYKIHAIS